MLILILKLKDSIYFNLKLIMTINKVFSTSFQQHVLQCTCCICSLIMFCRLTADWEWRVLVARRHAHIYTQRHTSASPPTLQPCLHLVPFITKDDARIVAYGMCVYLCVHLCEDRFEFLSMRRRIFLENENIPVLACGQRFKKLGESSNWV